MVIFIVLKNESAGQTAIDFHARNNFNKFKVKYQPLDPIWSLFLIAPDLVLCAFVALWLCG
jgi:hypothetical protein